MRNAKNTGGWTDELVDLLKKLWGDGYSASQIADALGAGLSRSAVIGKVHRLGLEGRKTAVDGRPRGKGSRPRQPSQRIASFVAHPFVKIEEMPKAPDHLGLSLLELKDGAISQCRFIHGDNDETPYTFCAQPVRLDSSYCEFHHRVCCVGVPNPKPRKAFIPARGAA